MNRFFAAAVRGGTRTGLGIAGPAAEPRRGYYVGSGHDSGYDGLRFSRRALRRTDALKD